MIKDPNKQSGTNNRIFSLFSSKSDEESVELQQDIAIRHRISEEWECAAKSYMKAAQICEKIKNLSGAFANYLEAIEMYRYFSPKEVIRLYKLVIPFYLDEKISYPLKEDIKSSPEVHNFLRSSRVGTAAKLWKDVAQMEEKRSNIGEAIKAYNECARCYKKTLTCFQIPWLDLDYQGIDYRGIDYKYIASLYEKIAMIFLGSQVGRRNVIGYLFRAFLCRCAIKDEGRGLNYLSEILETYCDLCPSLKGSQEETLMMNCLRVLTIIKDENKSDTEDDKRYTESQNFTNTFPEISTFSQTNPWIKTVMSKILEKVNESS